MRCEMNAGWCQGDGEGQARPGEHAARHEASREGRAAESQGWANLGRM